MHLTSSGRVDHSDLLKELNGSRCSAKAFNLDREGSCFAKVLFLLSFMEKH